MSTNPITDRAALIAARHAFDASLSGDPLLAAIRAYLAATRATPQPSAAFIRLAAALRDMVESYDILVTQSPLARHSLALGVIQGCFESSGTITHARAALADANGEGT